MTADCVNKNRQNRPKDHHYNPVFYLSQWIDEKDGKLWSIRNFSGQIKKNKRSPQNTSFEVHLYSYPEEFPVSDRTELEQKYFKPLDHKGSSIVRKILNHEELDNKERVLWAQFLCAMRIRTPENIKLVKDRGSQYLTDAINDDQLEYQRVKSPSDPEKFQDWIATKKPGLLETVALCNLPKIVANPKAISDILRMDWYALDFGQLNILITSDRPCIFTSGLQHPDCIIALPLSPQCAFVSFYKESRAERALMQTHPGQLASALNQNVVLQAKERAYSKNEDDMSDDF